MYTKLTGDGNLTGYLSSYGGLPAVFSDAAPEDAEQMYLVYTIDRLADDNLAIMAFNVMVDLYGRSSTRARVRSASERVEFLLDHATLIDPRARHDTIRTYLFSAGPVPEPDSQKIHYNLQFTARAGRKAWAAQLT